MDTYGYLQNFPSFAKFNFPENPETEQISQYSVHWFIRLPNGDCNKEKNSKSCADSAGSRQLRQEESLAATAGVRDPRVEADIHFDTCEQFLRGRRAPVLSVPSSDTCQHFVKFLANVGSFSAVSATDRDSCTLPKATCPHRLCIYETISIIQMFNCVYW